MGIRLVRQSYEILEYPENAVARVAACARVSRGHSPAEGPSISSDAAFVVSLLERDPPHLSPFEAVDLEVLFTTTRGIANELTRHRHCSFMQSSTRYMKLEKDFPVIDVIEWFSPGAYGTWLRAMEQSALVYAALRELNVSPQFARGVCPTDLACTLWVKANLRQWFHIFDLRLDKAAHPMLRQLLRPLYVDLNSRDPVLWPSNRIL